MADDERPGPSAPGVKLENFVATGGTWNFYPPAPINTVPGQPCRPPPLHNSKPLVALQSNVANDALLLAMERFPQPKCHPETRIAAQGVVTDWLFRKGLSANKDIMWLSGAPGVGKSAIVQTVCEALAGKDDPVHALHFFGRGQGDRDKAFFLPATIADQLCRTTTTSRSVIIKALKSDRNLLRQTLEAQFRKLVIKPAKARWRYLQKPITVVIDALDECNNIGDQAQLLRLIFEATTNKKIRFLIASRPEQQIVSFFHREDVAQRTVHIRLDEETFYTSQDIITFLRAEFARIRRERPQSCPDLPSGENWPGEAVILKLATDSDAQFIFPKLVIGYIDTVGVSPHQQLQQLLKAPCPAAFSKLDLLYHQILSRPPPGFAANGPEFDQYQKTVKDIVQVVLAWPSNLSAGGIARVLGLEVDVVQGIILGPLRTLFKFKQDDPSSDITFIHKSLRDHLLDAKRSQSFFIPIDKPHPIYLAILARQPLDDREVFMGILGVLSTLPSRWCPFTTLACVLDVEPDVVRSVVYGSICPLFVVDVRNERLFFFDDTVKDFLLDQCKSEDFHIPHGEPDSLFIRILSHQQLASVQRELLMEILGVVIAWPPESCTMTRIVANFDVEFDVVRTAVLGPMLALFDVEKETDCISLFNSALKPFLLDRGRSGEFHIASDEPDPFFLKVLDRQPSGSYNTLMALLRVLVGGEKAQPVTIPGIASSSGIQPGLLRNVIDGPGMRALLDVRQPHEIVYFAHPSFRPFLVNRDRAGRFYPGGPPPDPSLARSPRRFPGALPGPPLDPSPRCFPGPLPGPSLFPSPRPSPSRLKGNMARLFRKDL